jgi:hypothetical protein
VQVTSRSRGVHLTTELDCASRRIAGAIAQGVPHRAVSEDEELETVVQQFGGIYRGFKSLGRPHVARKCPYEPVLGQSEDLTGRPDIPRQPELRCPVRQEEDLPRIVERPGDQALEWFRNSRNRRCICIQTTLERLGRAQYAALGQYTHCNRGGGP